MIKSTMEKHTINWIVKKAKSNLLDFGISIQRKEVWDKEHKSNLIASILLGIPVESLLFEEEGEKFLVLDGKQRTTDIIQFVNNELPISDKILIPEFQGIDIVGKTFSELPIELQETILDYEMPISMLRPLTEDEREIVFFMRNQAVALTGVELTRVLLGSSAMSKIEELSKHEVMSKTKVSEKRYQNQQVVMESLAVMRKLDMGFSGNELKSFAKTMKVDGLSDAEFKKFEETLDFMNEAVLEVNPNLKKVNFPIVFAVAKEAKEAGKTAEFFAEWMIEFFTNTPEAYSVLLQSGVNGKANVKNRLEIMSNHYANY